MLQHVSQKISCVGNPFIFIDTYSLAANIAWQTCLFAASLKIHLPVELTGLEPLTPALPEQAEFVARGGDCPPSDRSRRPTHGQRKECQQTDKVTNQAHHQIHPGSAGRCDGVVVNQHAGTEEDKVFEGQATALAQQLQAPHKHVVLRSADGAGAHCHEGAMYQLHQTSSTFWQPPWRDWEAQLSRVERRAHALRHPLGPKYVNGHHRMASAGRSRQVSARPRQARDRLCRRAGPNQDGDTTWSLRPVSQSGSHNTAPSCLYCSIFSHSIPASSMISSVCCPCSGAPVGCTCCSSNWTGLVGRMYGAPFIAFTVGM